MGGVSVETLPLNYNFKVEKYAYEQSDISGGGEPVDAAFDWLYCGK
jgi:hypothetical protein